MNPEETALLLTDLYQLTMLQGYYNQNMEEPAVFEFFVRDLPTERNFLIAAGLEQVLDYLEQLHITSNELAWLADQRKFTTGFLNYLEKLRFRGDVHAMPEGTIFFPDQPILRITAPIPQAQLVETRVINLLQFQTMIASKAVRMTLAAPEKILVDFGLRRAHGTEAGLLAARASYLAGFTGTSTVLAGQLFGIPVYGTMAHSFVQAHDNEVEAFEHFALAQPANVVLLIDTYNTEIAAEKVVRLAPRLQEKGIFIKAVRLDSGNLVEHSNKVRYILDDGGLNNVQIFTSGNLDENILQHFTAVQAPIDGFGIGTRMVTSADAPYLDCAYKLVEYKEVARRKRSEGKGTWPGRKQVYRLYNKDGTMARDVLTVEDDIRSGHPLIHLVMQRGKRVAPSPPLTEAREFARAEIEKLPADLRQLNNSPAYHVEISSALRELTMEVDKRTAEDR